MYKGLTRVNPFSILLMMTLTEVDKILKEYGLYRKDSNYPEYHYDYVFDSKIFKNGTGILVVVEGCEEYTGDGVYVKPLKETEAHLRFYYYIEKTHFDSVYFMPTYHFMNWQDKNLDELTERWLRRMTNYVVKKIHSLENNA